MYYVELVIVLALLQYLLFALLVGRERVRGGVKAPAVSGHAGFERAWRELCEVCSSAPYRLCR